MGFLKEFTSKMASGLKSIFADDPTQYVEVSGVGSLTTAAAIGMKEGIINQKEAIELIKVNKGTDIAAENIEQRIEASITLNPSDKNDFRNDSTMENAQKVKVETKPAGELENHARMPGGREREDKIK